MKFPTNEAELKEQGYVFNNTARCKGCDAEIAWYQTPKGKMIPLDEGTLVAHWGTCPDADKFRDNPNPKTGAFSSKTDGYKR